MASAAQSQSLILKGNDPELLLREARRIASALNCRGQAPEGEPCGTCAQCRQIALGTFPYLFMVVPQGKAGRIQIKQIRELQPKLLRKAGEGQSNVAVIVDAHRMNAESQNCLLKTLEEPPERTLLLLLTGQPRELLPTVLSRCSLLDVRDTRPGPAAEDLELAMDVIESVQAQGYRAAFDKAAYLHGSRKNALPAFLAAMEFLLRNGLVEAMCAENPEDGPGPGAKGADFLEALRQVWKAAHLLERNVNPLLVLEVLFLRARQWNIRLTKGVFSVD